MLRFLFLLTVSPAIPLLGFLAQMRSRRTSWRVLLTVISLGLPVQLWLAHFAAGAEDGAWQLPATRAFLAATVLLGLGLLELMGMFLRQAEAHPFGPGKDRLAGYILRILAAAGVAAALFSGGLRPARLDGGETVLLLEGAASLIPLAVILTGVASLYVLEGTYRFARDYQRRIGRLGFLSLGILALFQVAAFSVALVYRRLDGHLLDAAIAVNGLAFPAGLFGLLRYRLGEEKISVPRDSVYASVTLLLFGAVFLGAAAAVYISRFLDPDFPYFARFFLGFSICFLGVLILGSGTMRRHVSRFVDRQLFSRKYDYQDQFRQLHRVFMSGLDLSAALTDLVENMKYAVSVGHAYIFLSEGDGAFRLHRNPESAAPEGARLEPDSPVARFLSRHREPVDLFAAARRPALSATVPNEKGTRQDSILSGASWAEPLLSRLGVDAVFPVLDGDELVGVLAMGGGRAGPFDAEDLELIGVFARCLGMAHAQHRLLLQGVERKQFETFHHLASFIVHDIKNQVSTLNLVLKNAERNLGDPEFQESMLRSVRSCAGNLESLVGRLSAGARDWRLETKVQPLGPIVERAIGNSGLGKLSELDFRLERGEEAEAPVDAGALFHVVQNLLANALEAMPEGGRLRVAYGPTRGRPPDGVRGVGDFPRGEEHLPPPGDADLPSWFTALWDRHAAYVLVEDSGPGMDPAFVRDKLFKPFATTKEKGIGIGLYQCKVLVENMGGCILCLSRPREGTRFWLLLGREER